MVAYEKIYMEAYINKNAFKWDVYRLLQWLPLDVSTIPL